jgi:hypothetical protein
MKEVVLSWKDPQLFVGAQTVEKIRKDGMWRSCENMCFAVSKVSTSPPCHDKSICKAGRPGLKKPVLSSA